MNDISVDAINLAHSDTAKRRKTVARVAAHRLFKGISIGSLTLYEGKDAFTFGSRANDSDPHAEVQILDNSLYREILSGGSIGAGESYMQGHWSSPDLLSVMRLFSANMSTLQSMDDDQSLVSKVLSRLVHMFNNNTLKGSRRNIAAHYDLGNDFFRLFLDESMMYSAAIFPTPESTLEEAAKHKLELLCRQLELKPSDHLLEIGTGWGGMALYAAREYQCRVTTTTLSREQYSHTLEQVRVHGLEDRITVLCEDYRDLSGQFDKLVSIEMIEAVGHQNYQEYFRRCSHLLKPNGLMALQAITIADQRFKLAAKTVDFIQRYIFPGGCLPSIEVMGQHISRDTDMQIINLRDITQGYADTLASWRERYLGQLAVVREQGFDESFIRMWEFYLCYCEGGFRERVISTVQLTIAKPGYRFGAEPS
jgi:cyclopropane-fatty-acyl-phospholipid synthase